MMQSRHSVEIHFRRKGCKPDDDSVAYRWWPSVPSVGHTVHLHEVDTLFEVVGVHWGSCVRQEDDGQGEWVPITDKAVAVVMIEEYEP